MNKLIKDRANRKVYKILGTVIVSVISMINSSHSTIWLQCILLCRCRDLVVLLKFRNDKNIVWLVLLNISEDEDLGGFWHATISGICREWRKMCAEFEKKIKIAYRTSSNKRLNSE